MAHNEDDQEPTMNELWARVNPNNDLETRAEALKQISMRLARAEDYFGAVSAAQTLGQLYEEAGDVVEAGFAHCYAGLQFMAAEEYTDAQKEFRASVDAFDKSTSDAGLAEALRHLGFAYKATGDHNQAIDAWHSAIRILECTGENTAAGVLKLEIGERQVANNQHELAIENFESANRLFEEVSDLIGVARSQQRIGKALVALGRASEAIVRLDIAIGMFTYLEEKHRNMFAKLDLGKAHLAAGFLDSAYSILEDVATEFKASSHHEANGDCQVQLSQISRSRGDLVQAAAQEKLARLIFAGCGAKAKVRSIDLARSMRMVHSGDSLEAEELLSNLLVEAGEEAQNEDLREVAVQLASIYIGWQQPERALQVLTRYEEFQGEWLFDQQIRWHNCHASALIALGRFAEARPHLEKAIAVDKGDLAPAEVGRAYELLAHTMAESQLTHRKEVLGQSVAYYLQAGEAESAKRVSAALLPESPLQALGFVREADGQLAFLFDANSLPEQ